MAAPRLDIVDLACLRGGRLVFAHLSVAIWSGAILTLTGSNGSGKSSLLRLLAGLGQPFAGRIDCEGTVALLGHQDAVKPQQTVREALGFWAAFAGLDDRPARIDAALETFDLALLADLPGRMLSAGQKRRLALARLVLLDADIWLLDEPTLGLDRNALARLEAALESHRARGGITVMATHVGLGLADTASVHLDDHAAPPLAA
jgi:heme exporter protein A